MIIAVIDRNEITDHSHVRNAEQIAALLETRDTLFALQGLFGVAQKKARAQNPTVRKQRSSAAFTCASSAKVPVGWEPSTLLLQNASECFELHMYEGRHGLVVHGHGCIKFHPPGMFRVVWIFY